VLSGFDSHGAGLGRIDDEEATPGEVERVHTVAHRGQVLRDLVPRVAVCQAP
jgi:hypothetical protein